MFQVFFKIFGPDDQRCGINTWVETELFCRSQFLINEKMNVRGPVIDKSEWRYGPRFYPKIFIHALIGSKREFPLFQTLFQVTDGEVL